MNETIYSGKIETGQRFVWSKGTRNEIRITVGTICGDDPEDRTIEGIEPNGNGYWNYEDRFREHVTLEEGEPEP